MTEITAELPRGRASVRLLQLLALALGSALLAAGVSTHVWPALRPAAAPVLSGPEAHIVPRPHEPVELTRLPRDAATAAAAQAARAQAALDPQLAADAALGFDRGLFVASPGGVIATAARVARWRPLVLRAVRGTGIDPNLLEAMVLVESSGYRNAIAGGSLASPAGLTQLTAAGARSLGLTVQLGRGRARLLASYGRRVDQRFVARAELRATAGYLVRARRVLGGADLAVASYHLGIANLAAATAGRKVSYADLYFGSAPDRSASVWQRLSRNGAVARDYYWKVLAAERVMRLYRSDRGLLAYEARLQARKNSSEEVLHPRRATPQFHTPRDIAVAWERHELRAIPRDSAVTHIRVSRFLGQLSHRFGRSRRLYAGLRPQALEVLLFIGRRVHELSQAERPLLVTSAVRDDRYQRLLTRFNPNATRAYSMHTTGYAFDILRSYANPRQAAAFQFVLERLQALHAIAYIREFSAMHIAVASDVSLDVLRRAG
jgi:Family of unknown function (DUF5715)